MPGLTLGISLQDGAEAYSTVVETHHKMNNMYFYAAMGLLMVSIPAAAKLRPGGQMRLWMSRSVALLLYTVNAVCILFLVIHFAPEMETIFDWALNLLGRIFG